MGRPRPRGPGRCHGLCLSVLGAGVLETSRGLGAVGWSHGSGVFSGPAQGAPSQYSSYQQGQGQQYGSYRASQTGPSAQQRPYGYEQASFPDAPPPPPANPRLRQGGTEVSVLTRCAEMSRSAPGSLSVVTVGACEVFKNPLRARSRWPGAGSSCPELSQILALSHSAEVNVCSAGPCSATCLGHTVTRQTQLHF